MSHGNAAGSPQAPQPSLAGTAQTANVRLLPCTLFSDSQHDAWFIC